MNHTSAMQPPALLRVSMVGRPRAGLLSWGLLSFAVLLASGQASGAQGDATTNSAPNDQGVAPALVYDGAGFSNLAGGLSRSSTYTGELNLSLTLELDRLAGWPDSLIYADGVWIHGGQPSALVGDAQGVSAISAAHALQLEELWAQRNFLQRQLSVLAGLYDLNSEFYRLASAGLFLNSSFGIGPEFSQSGVAGPSVFPATSVGARLAYKPNPNTVIRTAILDAVPAHRPNGTDSSVQSGDGALLVAEVALLGRPKRDLPRNARLRLGRFSNLPPYDDKLAIGAWHYTSTQNDLSAVHPSGRPVTHPGSSGAYLIADRLLAHDATDASKRTTAFAQIGISDERINRFETYVGVGLVMSGPFGRPASDQVGLAAAMPRNGSHYIASQRAQGSSPRAAETSIELTYLRQIADWLAVQPDLQYVLHPNTDPAVANALAFTLRFEIAFGKH